MYIKHCLLLAGSALVTSPGTWASPDLAQKHACTACHAVDKKVVGPSFRDIAAKYQGKDAEALLLDKMKKGGQGAWGPAPMPPQGHVPDTDLRALVRWVLSGAK